MPELMQALKGWESTLFSFGLIFAAFMVGLILYGFLFHFLERAAGLGWFFTDRRMVDRWVAPVRIILPLVMIVMVAPFLTFHQEIKVVLTHIFTLSFIVSGTWLLINTIDGLQTIVLARYDIMAQDNLRARAVHTKVNVLVKILLVVITVIAFAIALMTFERIKQFGVSILASAGIIGIIAGIAAQRSIANFIAGIQIALSQPIRIDDVVIVEGEWGIIEEITLTYVVVKIWDLRRLVVPIIYFLEKPFQNWTRMSSSLLGTVYIHTDYTIPVEELREELQRLVKTSSFWNEEVCVLHVTDAKERSLELRAIVSANNAGHMWELRCYVRENMIRFIRLNYPECLPRLRAELEPKDVFETKDPKLKGKPKPPEMGPTF